MLAQNTQMFGTDLSYFFRRFLKISVLVLQEENTKGRYCIIDVLKKSYSQCKTQVCSQWFCWLLKERHKKRGHPVLLQSYWNLPVRKWANLTDKNICNTHGSIKLRNTKGQTEIYKQV